MSDVWCWIENNATELIAITAVLFTAYQAYLSRKHNKLSVKPHITVSWANFSDAPISFTMCNDGLGPAIIKSYSIEVDGSTVEGQGPELYKNAIIALGLQNITYLSYNLTEGEAYSVGKSLVLLRFEEPPDRYDEINEVLSKLKFRITYTSIYEDKVFTYYGNS